MFLQEMTDVVPSIFATLNQGPLTLTLFLHGIIILPMFFIYRSESKKLNKIKDNHVNNKI